MAGFFLLLEFFTLGWMAYVFVTKKELSLVYLPFWFFSSGVYDSILPAFVNYLVPLMFFGYFIFYNLLFVKRNIFSILLIFYFIILLTQVKDFVAIRPDFFSVIWLFLLIPLIPEIYEKYHREEIIKGINISSFMILVVFIINTFFSTKTGFVPSEMYGINTGLLFGNVTFSDLNVLALAVFFVLQNALRNSKMIYLAVYLVAMILIILSMRRTVMALSILGSFLVIFGSLSFENIKKLIVVGIVLILSSLLIVEKTGFLDTFWERYEQRGLNNRPIENENRILEFGMVYRDLFVFYDYSPWFGFELFKSKGNYGKGRFGERTLHTDITNIVHSSGFLGLLLYTMMVTVAFRLAWSKVYKREDYLLYGFCAVAFFVYTITGRYTTISSTSFLFLMLFIPLSKTLKIRRNSSIKVKQNLELVEN